jgi:hypothetical protein
MLDKEDVSTAKEIAKVLRESKDNELVVVGNLITVLLAEREQHCTAAVGEDTRRAWVKLTDEEIDAEADKEEQAHGFIQGVAWAEAKLKEKNTK